MEGLDGRDAEMEALKSVEGADIEAITAQITKGKGGKQAESSPPPEQKPENKLENKPESKPENKSEVPNPDAIRTGMLNEMFGDQYKTVEDVKKANIPEALKERDTLRQKVAELTDSLAKKPKHAFASDDIAKLNEFARETGIKDATIFNKINSTDVANMSDMDALVMQHIIENPALAGKEPQVRKYFETKYNVDSKKVEAGDLTQDELDVNLIGVASDGARAKGKLNELKAKIKMPEIPAEETQSKKWTPEIETKQKAVWSTVSEKMGETLSSIPIIPEGWKDPIVTFVLPEEAKKTIIKDAIDYAISNQLETDEVNIKSIAQSMYSSILDSQRSKIYHAIVERARSMSEEEFLKAYHNPSPKNTDTAPKGSGKTTADEEAEKAYNLELGR